MNNLLSSINQPEDVQALSSAELPQLARELRETILHTVSETGGHLASNLGTVELTIALLRVFTPPDDKVLWDVGHQAYSWKLLTGRQDRFHTLRQKQGLSGFVKRTESSCDAFGAGHAGTALSAALGMAVARDRNNTKEQVVAIIGDGAMTNGVTLEALNSLDDLKTKLIVILNDNEMSISKNVGALSRCLGRMLVDVRYNRIKSAAEAAGHRMRMTFLRRLYHRCEQAIKSIWLRNAFFEEFGLRYIGPIDGHDFCALENALCSAREYKRPVLIHVATQKGKGYPPAERAPQKWHGVGKFNMEKPLFQSNTLGYSQAMGTTLTHLAHADPSIVAITAAMRSGTGLGSFANEHPARFFDVGICESHAVVFAAGLATSGYHPVFAVYSTFLQRAIDAVVHDVCLQNLPVILCIDRAGVVGADGPTHHGIYDIPLLRCVPGMTIMQPKDVAELAAMLKTALHRQTPCAIRYPREPGPAVALDMECEPIPYGRAEIVLQPEHTPAVWIWALGDMLPLAEELCQLFSDAGVVAGLVNARFIKPLDTQLLLEQAKSPAKLFISIENGALIGGFGSALREVLASVKDTSQLLCYGWQDNFVGQGTTRELLQEADITPERIFADALKNLKHHDCITGVNKGE